MLSKKLIKLAQSLIGDMPRIFQEFRKEYQAINTKLDAISPENAFHLSLRLNDLARLIPGGAPQFYEKLSKDFDQDPAAKNIYIGLKRFTEFPNYPNSPDAIINSLNEGGYYLSTLSNYNAIVEYLQKAHKEIDVNFNKTMFDKTLQVLQMATNIAYNHFNENKDKVSSFKKMAQLSHEEALQQANSKGWKPAKKTAGVWAREVTPEESPLSIQTLQGAEVGKEGDILTMGVRGEVWFQNKEKFNKKYTLVPGKEKNTEYGFLQYFEPVGGPVLVAQMDDPFTIQSPWGTLTGKKGDFVIKPLKEKNNLYPDDVWLIDREIFEETYSVL